MRSQAKKHLRRFRLGFLVSINWLLNKHCKIFINNQKSKILRDYTLGTDFLNKNFFIYIALKKI